MANEEYTTGGDEAKAENGESASPGEFETWKMQAREHYKGKDLKELVQAQADGRDEKERIERELKKCNAFYDVLRYEMVPGKMDEMGIDGIRYDGIGRVALSADLLVSTKPGLKDKLFGWLKKHKLADIIQPAINSSTLKAFVKGRIKAGKPYPDEFLTITPVTRASITAEKKK